MYQSFMGGLNNVVNVVFTRYRVRPIVITSLFLFIRVLEARQSAGSCSVCMDTHIHIGRLSS